MATETGIPEVISNTKGEGFPVELKNCESQLDEYPETCEFISENKQVAGSTVAEIINNVINSNFGALEDGSSLAAPSVPTVGNEEAGKPEHFLVDELNPSEIETSENAKHLEKGQEFGVAEETAREGEVVVEKNQKAAQDDKNNDTQINTETSSHVAKTGESKFELEGEETITDKINLDQNVEVILNQQDSVDEGPQSTEKVTKDLEKDETGKTEDSHTEIFSKEVPSRLEATLEHKNEVSVDIPDLTVNRDVQSATETCSKEEHTEERGFKDIKGEDKCIDLVAEEKGSEAIFSSENIGNEDEKDQIARDVIGDASISTIALSQESQNNENGDSLKDKLERISVADEVSAQDAETIEEVKHKEVPGIACEEKSQDSNAWTKQEKDEAAIENERQDESSRVSLIDAKAEDMSSQELDNPDILEIQSEIRSDDIAKESQIEITKQTEALEEAVQVNGPDRGNVNNDENSEQGLDSSSRKHEDIHGRGEGPDITEAAVEEAQDTEGSKLVATEDIRDVKLFQAEELEELSSSKGNHDDITEVAIEEAQDANESSLAAAEDISTVKLIQAEEHTELDSAKHEEHPDNSLLLQNEPEEKLQTQLNVISEQIKSSEDDATIPSIKEDGETKNFEEIFEQKEKGEEPSATCDTRGNKIPSKDITAEAQGEKIDEISELESHDKDQKSNEASTKEEKPDEDESESYQGTEEKILQPIKEQAEVQEEKIDEVSELESHEKDQKSNEASTKEEKPDEDESEAYQETEEKLLQDNSTEGTVPTETELETSESTEKHEKNCGLTSKESLESEDVGEVIPKEMKKEEVTDRDTQKCTTKSHETEQGSTSDDIQVEIPEEETLESRGIDESQRPESIGGNSSKEQIVEEDGELSIPGSIQGEISKSNQDNIQDAEKLNEVEITTEILKEGCINAVSQENIQEDAIKMLKDDENEAERSKGEVVEEIEIAGAGESIPCEISADASSVKQEEGQHEEGKHLDPTEALVEENKAEDTFSTEVVKEDADNKVKESEKGLEVASKGKEDQKQALQKNEPVEKFELLQQLKPEETDTEPSRENARNISCMEVEGTIQNLEETLETERKVEQAKSLDSTNDSEKEISEELETVGANESIPCDTKEEAESCVVASSVKQEDPKEDDKEQDPVEDLKGENKVEDTFSTKVEEDNNENNVKTTERSIEVASSETDQQLVIQKDEPREKPKSFLSEETETKPANEDATNITCMEREEVIQDPNEIPGTEKKGEKMNTDNANDSEKEVLKTTSAGQENREQGEELDSVEDSYPKCTDIDLVKDTEESQELTGLEKATQSTETERRIVDEQGIAELSSSSLGEEIVEKSSKEIEKEEDTSSELKEQKEVTNLVEEIELASLEDSAKPNKDFDTTKTTETPVEEKGEESQEKEPILSGIDSISTEILNEETSLKEAKPDTKEKVTNYNTTLEEKGLANSGDIELQSDSHFPESLKEETSLKDEEPDNKEQIKSVPKEEGLENSVNIGVQSDSVSAGALIEETTLKEGEPDNEDQIRSYDIAHSTIVVSEETSLKEAKLDKDEQVKSDEITTEEIASKEDIEVQSKAVSTEILSEKTGIKLAEQDHAEQVNDSNITVEETIGKEVASKGKEDQQQALQKDEPGVKLEILQQLKQEQTETEPSKENTINITCMEFEGTIQNLEETSETEKKGEKAKSLDGTNDSEKEVSQELVTAGMGESIPCETKEDVERFVVPSSVKQEDQKEVDKELDPLEDFKGESKVEDTFSTKVVEDSNENNVETIERSIEVASKGEADEQQAMQKDEPGEKVENFLYVTPEKTGIEPASEDATNITCMKREEVIQDLKEISEIENKEEKAKNTDDANDSEKEVLKTTSAGEETIEHVSRELDSVDLKFNDTETAKDTKESQILTGLEKATQSTEIERQNFDEQGIAEISSSLLGEEIAEGSSKEIEKEEDTHSEPKEQNEVSNLVEEIQTESLEDKAKPNKDFGTTKTTETPVEEKVAGEESQEKEPIMYGSDSVSTEIVSEETSLKEVESDNKEKDKNYDTTLEEKCLANSGVTEVQSDSPEILSEETSLKEAELDKEQDRSYNNVPKEEGLGDTVEIGEQSDSLSTRNVSQETSSKEGEPDNVEHVRSYDIAHSAVVVSEETSLKEDELNNDEQVKRFEVASEEIASNVDIEVQSKPISTEILSEGTGIKLAKQDHEEQVNASNIALEEKDRASNVDIDVQEDSVSTKIVNEETSLKEAKPDNEEHVKSFDVAPEEKGLVTAVDIEVQSVSVSAGTENEHDKQINGSNIAIEEKDMASNVDIGAEYDSVSTIIVKEETNLKEAEPDYEEHIKSFDTAPQEKGLVNIVDVEEQTDSVSDGIENEETSLKEAKQDHEEQVSSSNIALEDKDLASNVDSDVHYDSVSTVIANKETSLNEAELDIEEQVKSYGVAPEKKALVGSIDIDIQPDSVTVGRESEESCTKEATQDHEEQVNSSKIALEQKDQAHSVDIEEQRDSVSAEIVKEETILKEAEPDDEELVKSFDIAPENKGPVSNVDIEVKSDVVSAGTESEETCLEEAKAKNDEQVKSFDIAHEEEGLGVEEMGLKEAEQDNKEHVENSEVALEEKDVASNVGGEVQHKENSDLEESKEKKIPTIISECGEKLEQEVEDETPITRTGNKETETNIEKPLDDLPTNNLQDSSTVPLKENEPTIIEASEKSDETTATDKTECENEMLPIIEPTKEEGLLQRENDHILESYDTEKEVAEEENQKQIGKELNITPDITSEKKSSTSRDIGISEREEASEVCNLETLKDEEQSVDISNRIAACVDLENEKAILKKHETDDSSERSSKGVEGVQAAQDWEANRTKNGELPRNQNLEPDNLGQMPAYTSESVHEDQTEETLPLTKSEPEEEGNNVQEQNFQSFEQQILGENSEDTKEIKKEVEPKLMDETESPNEIVKDVIPTDKGVDKADESENTKEQVIDRESNQKESHPESIEDETVEKDKGSVLIAIEFPKATDSRENTSGVNSQGEENTAKKDEAFVMTAADEEIINEGRTKPVDVYIALPEEGKVEEEIKGEVDSHLDKNDATTGREATTVTNFEEAHLVDEPVRAFDNDTEERNLDLLKSECTIAADEVESVKLEERSFDLVPQHSNIDQKAETERGDIVEENLNVNEVEETKLASAIEDVDATRPIPDVEKQDTDKVKEEEIRNDQAPECEIIEEQFQAPSSTLLPEDQQHETETTVEKNEDVIEEVDLQSNEKEAPSSMNLQKEEPSDPKLHEVAEQRLGTDETEEDIKTAPETVLECNQESIQEVRKDEVIAIQAPTIGTSTEQFQVSSSELLLEEPEPEATGLVKKTEEETTKKLEIIDTKEKDSLATEAAKETYMKEEIIEAQSTVSTEDEIITDEVLPSVTSKDQLQVPSLDEQENDTTTTLKNVDEENAVKILDDENARDSAAIETGEEKSFQEEEPREIKVSDSIVEVLGSDETEKETKDASLTVSDEKIITCETLPEKPSEVELVEQSDTLLPREQEDGITTTTKAIEEEKVLTKTAEEPLSQKEEPTEHKVPDSTVEGSADKTEDITGASETELKENSPDNEVDITERSTDQALPVDKEVITTDQALPREIPFSFISVANEQENETAATVKKIEEEETKEAELPDNANLEDSCVEKKVEEISLDKEEPKKLDVSELEIRAGDDTQGILNEVPETIKEVPKIEPRESEEDTGNAEPRKAVLEAPTLDIGKREMASDLVSEEAQSHESLTTIEKVEIIENHLKEPTSREISQGEGSLNIEEAQSSHETCKEQTPKEADTVESTAAKITTSNKDGPLIFPDPVEETSQMAESKDTVKPRNETWVDREIKEDESIAEKTGPDSTMASLSELMHMQSTKEETTQVAEHLAKDKDPTSSKEVEHSQTHEEEHEEAEEEEEHEEDHPDAPILVQASKDIDDAKAKHKKSHGIFSGVGSKVKHSISKVKKAITGKSSHHSKIPPST